MCRQCGFSEQKRPERALPLFTLLNDRYLIGRVIGSGGFGITYKGLDITTNKPCAVKEYAPMNISVRPAGDTNIYPTDKSQQNYFLHGQQRFSEEAVMLKKLSNITEIVNITDHFSANNTSYFVMEYLDGQNLKSYYREQRRKGQMIPYEFCRRIMINIGYALESLHKECRIFHRDISPENIFITTTGDIKLIDFGNAKHCTKDESQNISVVLKPGFAPPEQYSSKGVQGPWTDIYALACTFYLIAGGEAVPSAPDRLSGMTYKPLFELNDLVSVKVSNAIDRALKLNYRERTQNIGEIVDIFESESSAPRKKNRHSMPSLPAMNAPRQTEPPPSAQINTPRQSVPSPVNQSQQKTSTQPINIPQIAHAKAVPYIKVIKGDEQGRVWRLPIDAEVTVGRKGGKSAVQPSASNLISNSHCTVRFSRQHGGFLVLDRSTNGTFINGSRLVKNKYYLIKNKASLALAGKACTIEIGVDKM